MPNIGQSVAYSSIQMDHTEVCLETKLMLDSP
jgi:hypothetical protein